MTIDLVEYLTDNIISYIDDNIGPYLDRMYLDRDNQVTMENPKDYFNYEDPIGYRLPAIIVLPREIDYRLSRGPNSINALIQFYVCCIVEDNKANLLQRKCFRYQDALKHILHLAVIENSNQKNILKVTHASFSSTAARQTEVDSLFRKEVLLTLEVEHFENEN